MTLRLNQIKDIEKKVLHILENVNYLFSKERISKISVKQKIDGSPLSELDEEVNLLITKELKAFEEFPVVSEESPQEEISADTYWILDPIDGTKALISGKDDFTVNIALINAGEPIFGAILQPMEKKIYLGGKDIKPYLMRGNKSKFPLKTIKKEAICNIVLSESHGSEDEREICEKLAKKYKETNIRRLSSSLKICRICEGRSNLYIRLGPINKWDIAAGHAILIACGGNIVDSSFQKIDYKPQQKYLIEGFYAFSHDSFLEHIIDD